MAIDIGALRGIIHGAELDELGSLTLSEAEDLPGGDDGVGCVAAALAVASMMDATMREAWCAQVVLLSGDDSDNAAKAALGEASSTCVITLAGVAMIGGAEAAARLVWHLCGGDPMGIFAARAVWVAGPSGLAIWGGTSRKSEFTAWESSVQVAGWEEVLETLRGGGP